MAAAPTTCKKVALIKGEEVSDPLRGRESFRTNYDCILN
jgi:hypothetical protein